MEKNSDTSTLSPIIFETILSDDDSQTQSLSHNGGSQISDKINTLNKSQGLELNLVPLKTVLNADNIDNSIKIQPKIETNIINKTILNGNIETIKTTNIKLEDNILPNAVSNLDKTNIIETIIDNESEQLVLQDFALDNKISLESLDINLLNN